MKRFYIIQMRDGSLGKWIEKGRYLITKDAFSDFHTLVDGLRVTETDFSEFKRKVVPMSRHDKIELRVLAVLEISKDRYIPFEVMDYQVC